MALPTYASPLERIWHYAYLAICGLVFLFLIAPILIVIPLSFNAEPYFTFTPKMLAFDPEGYSLRWYDTLLTLGHPDGEGVRDAAWWSAVWDRATWVQAAKNSFWVGIWATILATVLGTLAALGLSRPEMPYRRLIMALLISPMIVPIIIIAVGMSFFFAKACVAPDSALAWCAERSPGSKVPARSASKTVVIPAAAICASCAITAGIAGHATPGRGW